jgi:arylsulfatase A-like enzyme
MQNGEDYISQYPDYPKGIPFIMDSGTAFFLENIFAGVLQEIREAAKFPSYFSYFHLYAPHNPYAPARRFIKMFRDGYKPVRKPDHPMSTHDMVYKDLVINQQRYDQYIAQVDHEFGLLIDQLEQDGLLDDTYVIVTSDHGELFERSTIGHAVPFLYDSLIHIPLLIRAPGQTARADVHTPTNTVDLFPTLLALAGIDVPSNIDGQLLPGFGGQGDPNRAFFAMNASKSSAFAPLQQGIFTVQQGEFKLIHYRGYSKYPDAYELYNILEDPEELDNIMLKNTPVATQMKDQLLTALSEADEPYQRR